MNNNLFQKLTKKIFEDEAPRYNFLGPPRQFNLEMHLEFWLYVLKLNFDSDAGKPLWLKRFLNGTAKKLSANFLGWAKWQNSTTPISDYAVHKIYRLLRGSSNIYQLWSKKTEAPKNHKPIGRVLIFPRRTETLTFQVKKFKSISDVISTVKSIEWSNKDATDRKNVLDSSIWVIPKMKTEIERDCLGYLNKLIFHNPEISIYLCFSGGLTVDIRNWLKTNLKQGEVIAFIPRFSISLLQNEMKVTINCARGLIYRGDNISPRISLYNNSTLTSVMQIARGILATECYLDKASIERGYYAALILCQAESRLVSSLNSSPEATNLKFKLSIRKKATMSKISGENKYYLFNKNIIDQLPLDSMFGTYGTKNILDSRRHGGLLLIIFLRRMLHSTFGNRKDTRSDGDIDFYKNGSMELCFPDTISIRGELRFHLPALDFPAKNLSIQERAYSHAYYREWYKRRLQLFRKFQKSKTITLSRNLTYNFDAMEVYLNNKLQSPKEILTLISELW